MAQRHQQAVWRPWRQLCLLKQCKSWTSPSAVLVWVQTCVLAGFEGARACLQDWLQHVSLLACAPCHRAAGAAQGGAVPAPQPRPHTTLARKTLARKLKASGAWATFSAACALDLLRSSSSLCVQCCAAQHSARPPPACSAARRTTTVLPLLRWSRLQVWPQQRQRYDGGIRVWGAQGQEVLEAAPPRPSCTGLHQECSPPPL